MVSESCELDIIHLAGEDCAIPVVARHFQQEVANLAISEFVTWLGKCLTNCDLRNKKKLSIIQLSGSFKLDILDILMKSLRERFLFLTEFCSSHLLKWKEHIKVYRYQGSVTVDTLI